MGRKFLMSAAVSVAAFGCTAGPAFAKHEGRSLSNGVKPTVKVARKLNREMRRVDAAAATTTTPGTAEVVSHGQFAECTVPSSTAANGQYTNFFTKDTTNYVEFDGSVLVGECSADLTKRQTGATANDTPTGKTLIPYSGYDTYSEECNIVYDATDYVGDAESITYPDGEFIETCIVPVKIVG